MATNFNSLGLNFVAKNQNLLQSMNALRGHLTGIVGLTQSLSTMGLQAGKAMLSGLSNMAAAGAQTLGNVMRTVANDQINLTTGYEQQAHSAEVAARRLALQQGLTGRALDEVVNKSVAMSISTGENIDSTVNAVAAFKNFNKELRAVGITSETLGLKVESGLAIPVRTLGENLANMRQEFGFTDEQLNQSLKLLINYGIAAKDLKIGAGNIGDIIQLVRGRNALNGFTKLTGADAVKSYVSAAHTLRTLTKENKASFQGVLDLEQHLISAGDQFSALFSGVGAEVPEFMSNLSVVSGNVQEAFDAMQEGPDQFLKKFLDVSLKIKQQGQKGDLDKFLNHFKGRMSQVFGPEFTRLLVGAARNVQDSTLSQIASMDMMGQSLDKLAEQAHLNPASLNTQYENVVGANNAHFRSHGRQAARQFVASTAAAMKDANDAIDKMIAKPDSVFGTMFQKLSEMSSIGFKALIPSEARGWVATFQESFKTGIVPILDTMKQLGLDMGTVPGQIAIGIGSLIALQKALKGFEELERDQPELFQKIVQGIGKSINWVIKAIADGIKLIGNLLDKNEWTDGGGIFGKIFKEIDFKPLKDAWDHVWPKIKQLLKDAFNSTVDFFSELVHDAGIADKLSGIGETMARAIGKGITSAMGSYFSDMFSFKPGTAIGGIWSMPKPGSVPLPQAPNASDVQFSGPPASAAMPAAPNAEDVDFAGPRAPTQPSPKIKHAMDKAKSETGNLFDAVHRPGWYYDDYKALFEKHMTELKGVIVWTRSAGSGGVNTWSGNTMSQTGKP